MRRAATIAASALRVESGSYFDIRPSYAALGLRMGSFVEDMSISREPDATKEQRALRRDLRTGAALTLTLRGMWTAITRDVSASLGGCELSFVPRTEIDAGLAARQHHTYRQALESLGCRVVTLPAQDAMPDAVFVEDVALVLDEVAIMTRPGAESRRAEGASVADVLAEYRPLRTIEAPGTLDGGDVLRVGRAVYVGQSARSNTAAIEQLRELLSGYGYTVQAVPTRGCLHLKSAVTQVAEDTLLVQPAWVDPTVFADYNLIEVDPAEEHAANALRIGTGVIHPACFPRTRQRLEAAGIAVTAVDLSELQKAEGATTCCSLVFRENAVR